MGLLPRMTAREIISIVEKRGFSLARQSGSHKIYKNKQGKRLTIPFHPGKILHPKVLKNIFRDAEIEFQDLKK
ncbi:type II toxin-antitoxin system HicA family toxin [Patescibacteria group bacterium]|nr:type II toxin-antitoxin system HicA family toxin [Patescibacteria group bacterium]